MLMANITRGMWKRASIIHT
jgi:glutaredoxin-related protein